MYGDALSNRLAPTPPTELNFLANRNLTQYLGLSYNHAEKHFPIESEGFFKSGSCAHPDQDFSIDATVQTAAMVSHRCPAGGLFVTHK